MKKLISSNNEDYFLEDCPVCGANKSFKKDPRFKVEKHPDEKNSPYIEVQAWVCSSCGEEAFEEAALVDILNFMNTKEKKYIKYDLEEGTINPRIIH